MAYLLVSNPSAICQSLQLFGVPSSLYSDLRGGAADLAEIVQGQFDGGPSDVLLDARQLRGAWDWNNPWLLCKQPGERDLSRCRLLPFRDNTKQTNQGLIHFPGLGCKARDAAAKVGVGERRVYLDFPGKESLAERTIRNKADPEFLQQWQYFSLRAFPPERVFAFALDRRDRLNRMRPADGLGCCFRHAKVLHLAFLDEVLHGSRYV